MAIGWLFAVGFTVTGVVAATQNGMDRHIWDVPPLLWWKLVRCEFVSEILYFASTGVLKISVLLLYRRLVHNSDGPLRRMAYASIGGIVFMAVYTVAFILTLIFNCNPVEAYWKAYDPFYQGHYTCVDARALNLVTGVVAIVTDLYAVVLPCVVLRHVEASKRQKIALNGLFCLGLTICAASIARTYYTEMLPKHTDATWYSFYVYVTGQLEIILAIMCASAPSFRVLINSMLRGHLSGGLKSRSTRRSSDSTAVAPLSGSKEEHDHESDVKLVALPSYTSVHDAEAEARPDLEHR